MHTPVNKFYGVWNWGVFQGVVYEDQMVAMEEASTLDAISEAECGDRADTEVRPVTIVYKSGSVVPSEKG